MRRALTALDRRPWTVALLAGLGLTLLAPAALAFFAPPELLALFSAMGDSKLAALCAAFFLASACAARLAQRRRRHLEEDDLSERPVSSAPPPAQADSRPAARAHLR